MSDEVPARAQIGLLDVMLVRADDVRATAAFYRDTLGATVQSVSDAWAQVRLANVDIGIHARGADGGSWEPGFRVADIAAFKAHLIAHDVAVTQDFHDIPGGVKLGFRDAAGNALAAYQYGVRVADLSG